MVKVVLGPIVGKLTATSARIVYEVDQATDVRCILRDPDGQEQVVTQAVPRKRPIAFAFHDLEPGTKYVAHLDGIDPDRVARFHTFSENGTRFNVGAVSCNFGARQKGRDLWQDMYDRYVQPGQMDLLCHLGDQIYGDYAFQEALQNLNGRSRPTAAQERRIANSYRHLYRVSWNHEGMRRVLASTSNLMIWDDHEIRDDWGSRDEDRDPDSPARGVGRIARMVFREYQRQLWDDFELTDADPPGHEGHAHAWGKTGVLFLDQRTGRSFTSDPSRPYLGEQQWQDIQHALFEGELARCRALVVVTSVPLVFLGCSITTQGRFFMDDLQDHWSYQPHQKELVELVRSLRRWLDKEPGQRNLIVLGGDVHVGGHTDIFRNGEAIFRQLITSPITNHPPSTLQFLGVRSLLELEETIGGGYSFEHRDFTRKRNYGFVTVRVPESGKPRVLGDLVLDS